MSDDGQLVVGLVERLTKWLPHKTWPNIDHLHNDEGILTTRATLVDISASTTGIAKVLDKLVGLLESLGRRYSSPDAHPSHIVQSELYVLGLMADCCASHWRMVKERSTLADPSRAVPEQLSEAMVERIFNSLVSLLRPIPEGYVLPAQTILDNISLQNVPIPGAPSAPAGDLQPLARSFSQQQSQYPLDAGMAETPDMEAYIKVVVEFMTASSWARCLRLFQAVLYSVRTTSNTAQGGALQQPQTQQQHQQQQQQQQLLQNAGAKFDERGALVMMRLVSFFWVDAAKLGQLVHDIRLPFMYIRKSFQHTVAVVMPLLIIRWLDRFPDEFVKLHTERKRIDGAPDMLFDMTQSSERISSKELSYPLQTTLLFLLPDVFEVASGLRDAKGVTGRKVVFLDSLRKVIRNGNDPAGYCLVSLLRAVRHFKAESEAAIASYALDVMDDVRSAVFPRPSSPTDVPAFEQGMMTAAFVSLAHIDLATCIESLMPTCLHPAAPQSYKVAVVQGCRYFALQEKDSSTPSRFDALIEAAIPFVQAQLRAAGSTPMASTQTGPEADSPAYMLYNVLEFLDASPSSLFSGGEDFGGDDDSEDGVESGGIFESFVKCVISPDEAVQKLASRVARTLFADKDAFDALKERGAIYTGPSLKVEFWMRSSYVLLGFCDRLRLSRADAPDLSHLRTYLESRLLLLENVKELSELGNDIPDMAMASAKLETMLLVSLCTANVSAALTVTRCIDLFLQESRIVAQGSNVGRATATLLRNDEEFCTIASPSFRFTGMVAFQMRNRNAMRKMRVPTEGLVGAWEAAFGEWIHLCKDVSTVEDGFLERETWGRWRNLFGLLASLGGVCMSDTAAAMVETVVPVGGAGGVEGGGGDESLVIGAASPPRLRWIDQVHDGALEPILERFLRLSVQLLACPFNIQVSQGAFQALSSETSPALYRGLFRTLESELNVLFEGALASSDRNPDGEIMFAEKALSLLRALIDRLETQEDFAAAASINLGALTLSFAKFLDGFATDGVGILLAKIKVCHLCEAITRRKEHLNIRDDFRIRNQLVEHMFTWVSQPRSSRGGGVGPPSNSSSTNMTTAALRQDDVGRVRRDLDRASLRALADLTYRLPLQAPEGQLNATSSELKSKTFNNYFERFLSILNAETVRDGGDGPEGGGHSSLAHSYYGGGSGTGPAVVAGAGAGTTISISELAILILSNLLSANIDVGLQHSLSIGYHNNPDIRAAFVRVLYNILMQGTGFGNLDDDGALKKYDELLGAMARDMTLVTLLSAACPGNDMDELAIALLVIFERRGLTFQLLEGLIRYEIDQTDDDAQVLRRSCVVTRMLSVYAQWKGAKYLRETLQPAVERVIQNEQGAPPGAEMEVDPARCMSDEQIKRSSMRLQTTAQAFLNVIIKSEPRVPDCLRVVCGIISNAAARRFPVSKYTSIGSFIFLRFICPALVAPEVHGLVSKAPDKDARRVLLLVAKLVQTLANNAPFGKKEEFMVQFNDFLTQNIYELMTFLHKLGAGLSPEASAMVAAREMAAFSGESFDFGACMTVHRFMYDYADQLRQRLSAIHDRRDYARSPAEVARDRGMVMAGDGFRALVAKLGSPPFAVTWNRPSTTANSAIAYARFQDFMLRQASRVSESAMSSRSVCSSGQSRDGLRVITLVLRDLDADDLDHDSLAFACLKYASRVWNQSFGLFIDATCFSELAVPPDALFDRIAAVAPVEFEENLKRVYVYNISTSFRRTLRRQIRQWTRQASLMSEASPSSSHKKSAAHTPHSPHSPRSPSVATSFENSDRHSLFSPYYVHWVLLGTYIELQNHFYVEPLNLPKDTIRVVTDTRHVHRSVVRLSRSRGKVDVVIKVGALHLQITTMEKHPILANVPLEGTFISDTFRLGDIEEASTPIQTVDDSAFGLRAENGKMVMYFTSPHKNEILRNIRAAKAEYAARKHGSGGSRPLERLMRPQDVPGTLLNVALANLASCNGALRHVSYNLLAALCRAFGFPAGKRLVSTRDVLPPPNPASFIVQISRALAESERRLTIDFLTEFFVGWDSFPQQQRPLSLAYMAPWLPGLRTGFLATESDSDKARERVALVFRKLVQVATSEPTLSYTFGDVVWPSVCEDEVLVDILLDELVRSAVSPDGCSQQNQQQPLPQPQPQQQQQQQQEQQQPSGRHCSSLAAIVASIGTLTIRGRVVSKLRKTLNRSSLNVTRHLTDNPVWTEICVLLQFWLALSFNHGPQAQLLLPETFHVVTLLANTGSQETRIVVYRLLVNTIHAACATFDLDESQQDRLRASLDLLCEQQQRTNERGGGEIILVKGGLDGGVLTREDKSGAAGLGPALPPTETLAAILYDVCAAAAPTTNTMNAWRARWMGLVASTAFQTNPAIQPRAFAVMGCLARDEIDDDLLYQVLVALRHSLTRLRENGSSDMLVAVVQSLTKMMTRLPSASRYGLQLFWLAISLVRLVPIALFNCAAAFLEAVLANNSTDPAFCRFGMPMTLLNARQQLGDAPVVLDETYGVHFRQSTFEFAVCASLLRGLTETTTRATTLRVLSSLLGLMVRGNLVGEDWDDTSPPVIELEDLNAPVLSSPFLHLILARVAGVDELRDCLWMAGIHADSVAPLLESRALDLMREYADQCPEQWDQHLLLNTAMELVDFDHVEDSVQSRTLAWLIALARQRPSVMTYLCTHVRDILLRLLDTIENTTTAASAHKLLRELMRNPDFTDRDDSVDPLVPELHEMGFGGLREWCSAKSIGAGGVGGRLREAQRAELFYATDQLIKASVA